MDRFSKVRAFLEYDYNKKFFIEPEVRRVDITERLFNVIDTYKPGIIVKAGLGNGRILSELAEKYDTNIVIVDPSKEIIDSFIKEYSGRKFLERLYFIIGGFHDFPVDYYKADMLICIDCLSIFDSSKSIDEFKRALQFEGILYLSTVILADEDVEGAYDEFIHSLFSLHNDYYLEEDLQTFLRLKDFSFIKGSKMKFERSLKDMADNYNAFESKVPADNPVNINDARTQLEGLYYISENANMEEPYFYGCFMKNKPEPLSK